MLQHFYVAVYTQSACSVFATKEVVLCDISGTHAQLGAPDSAIRQHKPA